MIGPFRPSPRYAPALMLDASSTGRGKHAVVVGCGRVGSAVAVRLAAAAGTWP